MDVVRWRCAFVLVFFGRGGLAIDEIHRVKIVGLGEELRWLSKLLKFDWGDIPHLLDFVDM